MLESYNNEYPEISVDKGVSVLRHFVSTRVQFLDGRFADAAPGPIITRTSCRRQSKRSSACELLPKGVIEL